MPRPDDLPEQSQSQQRSRQRGADIDKFLERRGGAKWGAISIPAGAFRSQEIRLHPEVEDLVLNGQVFDANGREIPGHQSPYVRTEKSPTGMIIVLSTASTQDVTFLYRVVPESEREEEEQQRQSAGAML